MRNRIRTCLLSPLFGLLLGANPAAADIDLSKISIWGSSSVAHLNRSILASDISKVMSVHNGGFSGSFADDILAHQGSVPAQILFTKDQLKDLTTKGHTKVQVKNIVGRTAFTNMKGIVLGADLQGNLRYSAAEKSFIFEATSPVAGLESDTSYQMQPLTGASLAAGFQILNIGKNDLLALHSVESVLDYTQQAYNISPTPNQHILVMGHFTLREGASSAKVVENVGAVNAALKAQYGANFIDLDQYITGAQIWRDLNITPTAQDLAYQKLGRVAPSLSLDSIHLNAAAYEAVTTHLILPAVRALFLKNDAVASYVDLFTKGPLSATHRLNEARIARLSSRLRIARDHNSFLDTENGLRLSFEGLQNRENSPDLRTYDANLELAYDLEDYTLTLGLSRHSGKEGGFAQARSSRGTTWFGGVERRFGPWALGGSAGQVRNALSGRYGALSGATYSAESKTKFVEAYLGHRYTAGAWNVASALWVRKMHSGTDKIHIDPPSGLETALTLGKSTSTLGGIGVQIAYGGWQKARPALSLSYEKPLSWDHGQIRSSHAFIDDALLAHQMPPQKGNIIFEPSISFAPSAKSHLLLSTRYETGGQNHGLGLRYTVAF